MHALLYYRQCVELVRYVQTKVSHRPLEMLSRYFERIDILNETRQNEIIHHFQTFIESNRDGIENRQYLEFNPTRIQILKSAYIDFIYIFEHIQQVDIRDEIWNRLAHLADNTELPRTVVSNHTSDMNPLQIFQTLFEGKSPLENIQSLTQTMQELMKPINENEDKIANNPAMKSMVHFANEALKTLPSLLNIEEETSSSRE